jgi:hypothetical protein
MKRIEIVNNWDKDYGLMQLIRGGMVEWTEARDRDIYLQYDIYRRMGKKIMDAKETTATDFNVSIETVHRAIRKMNEEVRNTFAGTKGEA